MGQDGIDAVAVGVLLTPPQPAADWWPDQGHHLLHLPSTQVEAVRTYTWWLHAHASQQVTERTGGWASHTAPHNKRQWHTADGPWMQPGTVAARRPGTSGLVGTGWRGPPSQPAVIKQQHAGHVGAPARASRRRHVGRRGREPQGGCPHTHKATGRSWAWSGDMQVLAGCVCRCAAAICTHQCGGPGSALGAAQAVQHAQPPRSWHVGHHW